jgi:hypothetical protein
VLKAIPREPLYQLRIAMHEAVAAALGPAKFSEPRPAPDQFTPHMSVAYASQDGPAEPIAEALRTGKADAVITFGQAFCWSFIATTACTNGHRPLPSRSGSANSLSVSRAGRALTVPSFP